MVPRPLQKTRWQLPFYAHKAARNQRLRSAKAGMACWLHMQVNMAYIRWLDTMTLVGTNHAWEARA